MAGKRGKRVDLVLKLQQVEVLNVQAKSVSEAALQIGVMV